MLEKQSSYDTETLYCAIFTPLFRYVFFRTHDYDLASDITQQSFLKFLMVGNLPKTIIEAQRLLFVIARNLLTDHWRSSAVQTTQSVSNLDREWSEEASIEATLITQDDVAFVRSIMEMLDDTEADIVSMRLADDLPYQTIAALLDISAENARQIYSRALRKLRQHVSVIL